MIGMARRRKTWWLAGMLGVLLNLHPIRATGQGAATEWREVHMGMEVRIVAHGAPEAVTVAVSRAFDRIAALDAVLSDWRHDSELTRLAGAPAGAWLPVSEPVFAVLARALDVAAVTDGAFDPTVGPLTSLWRESRRTGHPVDPDSLAVARARVGWRLVTLDTIHRAIRFERPGMRLDLGAIAKGYILGRARQAMAEAGITAVLIEAGGDMVVGDAPPGRQGWRVDVATSAGDSVLVVSNTAIATSGPAAQWIVDGSGVRRSHVIDPRDGLGSTASAAVTVIGSDPAITDAIATALTLVTAERRASLADRFGVVIVTVSERSEQREASGAH